MIRLFKINNFKSLVDFDIALPKFTVLIGMNGVGKTTILQACDFLSRQMDGKVQDWLDARQWTAADLGSKLATASNIRFSAVLQPEASQIVWAGAFNRKELACVSEVVHVYTDPGDSVRRSEFESHSRQYRISDGSKMPITFTYQGSLLSQLRDSELTPELKLLRDSLRQIRSLEQLSPHLMRQRTRVSATDVGASGERLSPFLHSIKGAEKAALLNMLRRFYPRVVDFKSAPTKGGWKRLSIVEDFDGKYVETEVRHINDGLLRILAMLAQTTTDHSTLLFDEIENGVNPEIVEKLVDLLVNARQQIIVTTHSPMILNYLEDDVARKSVLFVYKTPQGITRVRPFFKIAGIGEKLQVMGPGEAFADTDLQALTEQCVALDLAEAEAAVLAAESEGKKEQAIA